MIRGSRWPEISESRVNGPFPMETPTSCWQSKGRDVPTSPQDSSRVGEKWPSKYVVRRGKSSRGFGKGFPFYLCVSAFNHSSSPQAAPTLAFHFLTLTAGRT